MSSSKNIVLEAKNISKYFGTITALENVNLTVRQGECLGVVGDNGAGKTNILDAIHYLSQSKSYFNHIDAQNIQFKMDYFMLKGNFTKQETTDEIQCNLKKGEGKVLKKNQKKYKRFSEHIGQYPSVIISPTDSNLILEGSEVRRKYLDSSIAQYKQSYLKTLINYNLSLIHI